MGNKNILEYTLEIAHGLTVTHHISVASHPTEALHTIGLMTKEPHRLKGKLREPNAIC